MVSGQQMNECQSESMQIDGLGPGFCKDPLPRVSTICQKPAPPGPGRVWGWAGTIVDSMGRGGGLLRISDRTEPIEITPDGSTQYPDQRTDRDNDRRLDCGSTDTGYELRSVRNPHHPTPVGRGGGGAGCRGGLGSIGGLIIAKGLGAAVPGQAKRSTDPAA